MNKTLQLKILRLERTIKDLQKERRSVPKTLNLEKTKLNVGNQGRSKETPVATRKRVCKGLLPESYLKETSRYLITHSLVLNRICPTFSPEQYRCFTRPIILTYNRLVANHGVTEGSSRYKNLYTYVYNLVEGLNPENPPWTSTERDTKIPTTFKEISPLILLVRSTSDLNAKAKAYQALQTLFSVPRLSEEIPELDLGPVTDPQVIPNKMEYLAFRKDFRDFIYKEVKDLPRPVAVNLPVIPSIRMTAGPNGSPTLAKAPQEAKLLMGTKNLAKAYANICERTGNADLLTYLNHIKDFDLQVDDVYLGKLDLVQDSLNKHRLVAMVDYWTNLLLGPIEGLVKDILRKKFPSDFMFNHELGGQEVRRRSTRPSWSVDLKEFTNRFPARLQQMVLGLVTDPGIAHSWYKLLCERDYYVPKLKAYTKYSVGQPMGAKASFAIASLTHHLVIWFAYRRAHGSLEGVHDSYVMVGDDVTIFDQKVYEGVTHLYTILGLEISKSKSKFPVESTYWAEFCSRTFLNGIECSRVSPKVILLASKGWEYVPLLLSELLRRGIDVKPDLLPLLPSLYRGGRQQVAYSCHLKDFLLSGLLSPELEVFASGIETPSIWESLDLSRSDILNIANNVAIWRVAKVVQESLYAAFPEKENRDADVDVLQLAWSRWDLEFNTSFYSDAETGKDPKSKYTWRTLASLAKFKVKGWDYPIPHPASIATVREYIVLYDLCRDVFGPPPDQYSTKIEYLKDLSKKVGRVMSDLLPREANELVARGNDQETHHQYLGYLSRTLVRSIQEARIAKSETFLLKKEGIVFKLPVPGDPPSTCLFQTKLNKMGVEDPVEMGFYLSLIRTTIRYDHM